MEMNEGLLANPNLVDARVARNHTFMNPREVRAFLLVYRASVVAQDGCDPVLARWEFRAIDAHCAQECIVGTEEVVDHALVFPLPPKGTYFEGRGHRAGH